MGVVSDLKLVQLRLVVLVCILFVLLVIPLGYYVLTRKYRFTYFGSPTTYGMLTSERFASLDWWTTYFWMFSMFPLLWVGTFMLLNWKSNGYKTAFIVYLSVTLALWLCTFVVHIVWLRGRNNPADPDNPASSYRRCCTPEFYNVVPTCENYGSATPECNPPINLSELGTNGDFWIGFSFNVGLIVLWAFFLYFTIEFMKLINKYGASGGDSTFLKNPPPPPAAAAPPQPSIIYTQPPQVIVTIPPAPAATGGPMLVDAARRNVASRAGTLSPFASK